MKSLIFAVFDAVARQVKCLQCAFWNLFLAKKRKVTVFLQMQGRVGGRLACEGASSIRKKRVEGGLGREYRIAKAAARPKALAKDSKAAVEGRCKLHFPSFFFLLHLIGLYLWPWTWQKQLRPRPMLQGQCRSVQLEGQKLEGHWISELPELSVVVKPHAHFAPVETHTT